jgi:hypothetical protein
MPPQCHTLCRVLSISPRIELEWPAHYILAKQCTIVQGQPLTDVA